VGDGLAERAASGGFFIDMNPLVILGAIGEIVDALLVDRDPVADADLLAYAFLDFLDGRSGSSR